MDHVTLEKLVDKTGSKFVLATFLMKRMRELQNGAPPLIENAEEMTIEAIAVKEILENKVELLLGKKALRLREEKQIDEIETTPVQWTDNLLTSQ
ncbi:MAG: DNA-directed RNA polymerase subunit omega [Planctomycetota bacterium]